LTNSVGIRTELETWSYLVEFNADIGAA